MSGYYYDTPAPSRRTRGPQLVPFVYGKGHELLSGWNETMIYKQQIEQEKRMTDISVRGIDRSPLEQAAAIDTKALLNEGLKTMRAMENDKRLQNGFRPSRDWHPPADADGDHTPRRLDSTREMERERVVMSETKPRGANFYGVSIGDDDY